MVAPAARRIGEIRPRTNRTSARPALRRGRGPATGQPLAMRVCPRPLRTGSAALPARRPQTNPKRPSIRTPRSTTCVGQPQTRADSSRPSNWPRVYDAQPRSPRLHRLAGRRRCKRRHRTPPPILGTPAPCQPRFCQPRDAQQSRPRRPRLPQSRVGPHRGSWPPETPATGQGHAAPMAPRSDVAFRRVNILAGLKSGEPGVHLTPRHMQASGFVFHPRGL